MNDAVRRKPADAGPDSDPAPPSPPAPRISRKREESRRKLIEAARETFAQRGIRETPVELICEKAGFTRGAFYSNFQSKEDLFLAVWEIETAQRNQRVAEAIAAVSELPLPHDVDGLRSAIADMARRYVTLNAGDETWFALLLEYRLQGLRQEELRPQVMTVYEHSIQELATVIEKFLDRVGIELTVHVRYVAQAILALYNEALLVNLLRDFPLTEDNEFLTEVIPRLLSGLLPAAPAPPGGPGTHDEK
jgi:AcrR family transcriptional regulator